MPGGDKRLDGSQINSPSSCLRFALGERIEFHISFLNKTTSVYAAIASRLAESEP